MRPKALAAMAAVVMLWSSLPLPQASAEDCPPPRSVGRLNAGSPLFWDGAYVDGFTGDGYTTDAEGNQVPCSYTYELDVGDGARLRVGLDLALDYRRDEVVDEFQCRAAVHCSADGGRRFLVEIVDPDGSVALAGDGGFPPTSYGFELFLCMDGWPAGPCESGDPSFSGRIDRPSAGPWMVRVTPLDSSGWLFRMRARLEHRPQPSGAQPSERPVLPNLRSMPPFELTFCEPFFFGPPSAFTDNSAPVCDAEANGLTAVEEEELALEGKVGVRGLRFSAGPENAGDGPFEVRDHPVDTGDGTLGRAAYQRLYASDGAAVACDPVTFDCPAGTFELHTNHGHWHYQMFRYELFEVVGSNPADKVWLGSKLQGRKAGFCPGDERIADWGRFFQHSRLRWETDRTDESCTDRPVLGLSRGWGDYYEWQRLEQYVEFPNGADGSPKLGFYLLRTAVDPHNHIRETDDADNASFVYFEVCQGCGRQGIRVIERGYGLEP